jgi:hypothetical protein
MKILRRFALIFATTLAAGQLFSAENARVAKPRILVRAQPSIHSEILTKLEQGEQVSILEEVAKEKAKEGEPAKWLKIQMPANVPVWVFSPYLNPDNTIKVSRLNLRAGPGENYSVVGRLERGAAIKPIRQVEEWTEVETPTDAYGFIAADLVERSGAQVAASNTPPSPAQSAAQTKPLELTTRQLPEDATPPPAARDQAPAQTAPPVDLAAQPPAATSRAPQNPSGSAPPATSTPATPQQPVFTDPSPLANQEKGRTVRREGIIRSTRNHLAPTYEELINAETRKTVNFLWTGPNGVDLKLFRGKKVVVTGEEGLDPKFPKIPVIEIHAIEPAPDVLSESN